ncbi:hypothetical protein [Methylocystis echinoides]|uniref:Uncharacterized protein n=1 Tax=Methylocystis echinoides TaxID=29468 RepID=A0A9W6GWS2_9HYPH|nr:hypothetical protein [Methylocystis echinoides]GLI94557.1 hypothetical protein LMG27198_35490 [Methylocystis echinoides]
MHPSDVSDEGLPLEVPSQTLMDEGKTKLTFSLRKQFKQTMPNDLPARFAVYQFK